MRVLVGFCLGFVLMFLGLSKKKGNSTGFSGVGESEYKLTEAYITLPQKKNGKQAGASIPGAVS